MVLIPATNNTVRPTHQGFTTEWDRDRDIPITRSVPSSKSSMKSVMAMTNHLMPNRQLKISRSTTIVGVSINKKTQRRKISQKFESLESSKKIIKKKRFEIFEISIISLY